ncbi:hypothetical protein [Tenacibaculum jejuense]|uniref:Uncharacterized protein n=1 Tax=Tenacibaculum jejuense TaxID=584609 RepID=A0A238UFC4_9FLAO|nr:hypothetical protein [Tenacibaculum jejuense]SNR17100.1 protein of unknown function [Tenacibaculum jejuense]
MKRITILFKTYVILVMICFTFTSYSQSQIEDTSSLVNATFTQRSKNKLQFLGVDYKSIDFESQEDLLKLNLILQYDKRQRSNEIFAYIFSGFSLVSLIGGLTSKDDNSIFSDLGKGVYFTSAIVYGGISIPFWIGRRKYRRQRDQLVKLF